MADRLFRDRRDAGPFLAGFLSAKCRAAARVWIDPVVLVPARARFPADLGLGFEAARNGRVLPVVGPVHRVREPPAVPEVNQHVAP